MPVFLRTPRMAEPPHGWKTGVQSNRGAVTRGNLRQGTRCRRHFPQWISMLLRVTDPRSDGVVIT